MNRQNTGTQNGFTLIELLVVIIILSMVTVTIFRFYHEAVRKDVVSIPDATTYRDARVLFNFLQNDLQHASELKNSFNDIKADENTLIIKSLLPGERQRILSKKGNLSHELLRKNFGIIVYRLNESGEIIREVFKNTSTPPSKIALLGDVNLFKFTHNNNILNKVSLVKVQLTRNSIGKKLWSPKKINRIFHLR